MDEKKDMDNKIEEPDTPFKETGGVHMEGHIRIFDPDSGEEYVNKRNAIHYENMSEALALSVSNKTTGFIHEMAFGNGGTNVDLYNQTYYEVVDDNSSLNTDAGRNKLTVNHISGNIYSDIVVSCLLDYGEPSGQQAFDNTSNFNDTYTFDELGLKSWIGTVNTGRLLTHVIFHPVQKSLNRLIQIDYTIRIQTLTNLSSIS